MIDVMAEPAQVGFYCPNRDCVDFAKTGEGNIIRFGKSRQGKQRFRCKTCGQTFNENYGTLFHGKRYPEEEIVETLALLGEGSRITSLARAKGIKEDTILSWLREAAEHAEAVEDLLQQHYEAGPAQLDALWSYVGHKGAKKTTPRPTPRASSGAQP